MRASSLTIHGVRVPQRQAVPTTTAPERPVAAAADPVLFSEHEQAIIARHRDLYAKAASGNQPVSALLAAMDATGVTRAMQSPQGRRLALPVDQQPAAVRQALEQIIPRTAVGMIRVTGKPYAATAFYIGEKNGVHCFMTEYHVTSHFDLDVHHKPAGDRAPGEVVQSTPLTFEVDPGTGKRVSIPLVGHPIAASRDNDKAIVAAREPLSAEARAALAAMTPLDVTYASLSQLNQRQRDLGLPVLPSVITGYAAYKPLASDLATNQKWTPEARSEITAASAEATRSLASEPREAVRTLRQGYIRVFNVGAQIGREERQRDPDSVGGGFLVSPDDVSIESMALDAQIEGGMSGSPVVAATALGPMVVGGMNTSGHPGDIHAWIDAAAKDPHAAFPQVDRVRKSDGGTELAFHDGHGTPAGGYASTTRAFGDWLGTRLSDQAALPANARYRGVLEAFHAQWLASTQKLLG